MRRRLAANDLATARFTAGTRPDREAGMLLATLTADHPGELHMQRAGRNWRLVVTGPDVHGYVVSSDRRVLAAFAQAYAKLRQEAR